MYSLDDKPFFDLNSEDVKKSVNAVQPLQAIGGGGEPTPPPLGPSATEAQLNSILTGKMLEGGAEGIYQGGKAAMGAMNAASTGAAAAGEAAIAQGAAPLISAGAAPTAALTTAAAPVAGTAAATGALGAGAGAAGTAALGALGPVGIGIMGAKMLGLFNNGTTSVPGYYSGTPSVEGGGEGVSNGGPQATGAPINTSGTSPMGNGNNIMDGIEQLLQPGPAAAQQSDQLNLDGNASSMAGNRNPVAGGK